MACGVDGVLVTEHVMFTFCVIGVWMFEGDAVSVTFVPASVGCMMMCDIIRMYNITSTLFFKGTMAKTTPKLTLINKKTYKHTDCVTMYETKVL